MNGGCEPMMCCVSLVEDNERLIVKVGKLKEKIGLLKKQLNQTKVACSCQCLTTSDDELKGHCEIHSGYQVTSNTITPAEPSAEMETVAQLKAELLSSKSRLMALHNKTTRLYQTELKRRHEAEESIVELKCENADLRENLANEEKLTLKMERKISELNQNKFPTEAVFENKLIADLKERVHQLAEENTALRQELSSFDQSFFDEIQDLKYKAHSSQNVINYYEKTLKSLCRHYKIPFIKPPSS